MTLAIFLILVGLILLMWSADKLVFGSAALAKNFGISPLVIGMTILAMGSSAPEMIVSATAALGGKTDTAVGNVLGSNITNIALILGITAIIKPLAISSNVLKRELPLMIGATALAGLLLSNHYLSLHEGILLIALFVVFIIIMLRISQKEKSNNDPLLDIEEEVPTGVSNTKAIFWIIVGLGLLPVAATLLVDNAVIIAKYFGMSDLTIGLTIIAIGTSLPELAASLAGALKGEDDMAVGNIIGSNIFNILAVMGLPAILNPSAINPLAMDRDFWVMLGISVILVLTCVGKSRRIGRGEGFLLLACFVIYLVYLLTSVSA